MWAHDYKNYEYIHKNQLRLKIFIGLVVIVFSVFAYLTWLQGPVKICLDFNSREQAQRAYNWNKKRYAHLDRDKDGLACQNNDLKKKV